MEKKTTERILEQFLPAFFIFLLGAVIGWIYEVGLHIYTDGMFVNRGMLHGPWLPIYGIGALLIVILKSRLGRKPVLFFAASVAACAVLEYVTSWGMEMIYHTRWWDYSDLPLNLHGRIFLGGLLGFGIAGLIFAYILLPLVKSVCRRIPKKLFCIGMAVLLAVFATDYAVSLVIPNIGVGISTGATGF